MKLYRPRTQEPCRNYIDPCEIFLSSSAYPQGAGKLRTRAIYYVATEVSPDRRFDRREEDPVAEVLQQPKAAELVFDRILEFGKQQFDALRPQGCVQLDKHIRRSDIDAGHRFGGNDDPTSGRRRLICRLYDPFLKELG